MINKPKQKRKLVALRAYVRFTKPYRLKMLFVLLIFTAANIFLAVIPLFIGKLVGAITVQPVDTGRVWMYAAILIACSSGHDVLWRGAEFAYRGFLNKINYLYETFLFSAVIRKPYPFFVDKLTGKISSYITTISDEFKTLLDQFLFDFSGQIVNIIATILILSSLNWQTAAIFVVGLIGMIAVGRHTLGTNMKDEAAAADIGSSKNGILFDAVANFASVKALKTEAAESRTIANEQGKTIDANQKAFLTGIIFWGSMSLFVRHLIWPCAIVLNVVFFLNGELSIGELATLLSTVLIFSSTIWDSVWHISQVGQKMAKIDEAHSYLFGNETDIAIVTKPENPAPVFKNNIQLKDVSFAYPDKQDVSVLKNINLTIKQGEKIGIVGRSGSGKSTLTKLLLDYYPVDDGHLLIDNKPVNSEQFSKLVAFVPQDTSLFHRSIADNIGYGSYKNLGLDKIKKAAQLAEAHEFIEKLPEGYNTLIGERGVKLSGGQRQRIAIARAIVRDAPVLILDEATSALDSESESLIQEALWRLMKNRTAIVIAHRLSTIQKMDRIVVFDQGEIIEQGTHAELLEKTGTYSKLWAHQSGGFLEDLI